MRTDGNQVPDSVDWPMELAQAVRRQRKALKLTQVQLSELAGCGTAFLYELETGKPTLRLNKLIDVLNVLGLQLTVEPGKQGLRVSERVA